MEKFEVERVGGELKRFGVAGDPVAFEVVSPFEPAGDQPQAIASLVQGVKDGDRYQVLLGVTGSGTRSRVYTMAKTIEALGKPTLVMAPNKTLAAQLASELKEFFPITLWFTSSRTTTTTSPRRTCRSRTLTSRRTPPSTRSRDAAAPGNGLAAQPPGRDRGRLCLVHLRYRFARGLCRARPNVDKKEPLERDDFIHTLIDIQYDRNDFDLARGTFRVRGDVVDVYPPYAEHPLRFEFFATRWSSSPRLMR